MTAAFALGLLRRPRASNRSQVFVSVVVAARNEEAFIADCLESLSKQTYPANCYEIIVVDDDSSDRTREIVESFEQVRCLKPSPEYAGFAAKKRPMATGVAKAKGELILTTDADCTVPETWVETIVAHFEPGVSVVTGYSRMAPVASGWVHRFQAFDFFALLAAAAGSAGIGRAWGATGQNLAYRREIYDRVGGFSRISTRPSGDDVLLLQLFRKAGARVSFCLDVAGHVTTWRSESLPGLINQRKRWASNAVVQLRLNPFFFAYIISVFVVNALPVLALVLKGPLITLCLAIWCLRTCVDASVIWLASRRLGTSPPLTFFPIWLLLQIPYVLLVGTGSLFGFNWKDRDHTAKRNLPNPCPRKDQPDANHVTM